MNVVQSAISSARFNRMLLVVSTIVLTLGVGFLVFQLAGGSDKTSYAPDKGFRPTLPAKSVPLTNENGDLVKTYEQLSPQVRTTIRTFLATAVARKHLEQSWGVVAPSLRTGYTFQEWKNATALPIIPYPVADVDTTEYYLDYASTKEILLEVGLSADPKADIRPTAFQLGLRPVGKGDHQRWLVSYWMPRWTPPIPIN